MQVPPHCPGSGGSPPRSGSPHHSNAARWAECCLQRRRRRTGGGRRPPWCGHNVSGGAEESPAAGVRWGCVSTWGSGRRRLDESAARPRRLWTQVDYPHVAFKLKLEEIVGDFGSALTGKHKHLVPAYGHGEIATRRGNLATLGNLMKKTTKRIRVSAVSALLVWAQCPLIFQVCSRG